jgi:pimeloyl-ACP methyl ester carboxylesterase
MVLITILAAIAVLLVLALLPGFTPGIRLVNAVPGQHSVATLEKVAIGNSQQWLLIRSEDTRNPLLLFVHGGPGTSQLTLMRRNTRTLEKHFTIVNWDQRGAGKSYPAIRDKTRMNMEQFVADIIELTKYLQDRFRKRKVTLVGHSWGSAIGVLAVQRRPDLFNAYIGIGQISNAAGGERISYDWALQQARAAGDQGSVRKLTEIGPPPYAGNWRPKFLAERRILGKHGGEYHGSKVGAFGTVIKHLLFSTEYTFMDRINFFRGIFDSLALLIPPLGKLDLFLQAPRLKVPVFFMLGKHDYEVPSILSAKYFQALQAPLKSLFWFENSAHMPNTEERDKFNSILIETVLPVVTNDS